MANILLVDSDEVAKIAMGGIVRRGEHRFTAVRSVSEAWKLIRGSVRVDLVFVELKLEGEGGLMLIQQLKADCILRSIPVVVYTAYPDKDSVRKVLELKVQNFLVKPYRDEAIFAEISKASSEPWVEKYFELGNPEWEPERLNAMLVKLEKALEGGQKSLASRKAVEGKPQKPIVDWLKQVSMVAEKSGADGVVRCLDELVVKAGDGLWPTGDSANDPLGLASRLIHAYLSPDEVPEAFLSEEEAKTEEEARARKFWSEAVVEGRCPVIGIDQLKREFGKLTSCPIVESISASYKMAATGRPTSLAPIFDLVKTDPGLTVEVLVAANRLKKDKEAIAEEIESTRMAVGYLGENRLVSIGSALDAVAERFFETGPSMDWPAFRMFQVATGRIAQYLCEYLEMPSLAQIAYTAGLLHDLGKLLLVRLHPQAFPAIQRYALDTGLPLSAAERHFLGCTSHDIAAEYAEKVNMPKCFQSVYRWINNPSEASVDLELVAAVSLARDLCRHNRVGSNGDTPTDVPKSLQNTPEWQVLKRRVYLGFDLKKFERLANSECRTLKLELAGKPLGREVA